jgi:predicted amidophosphoribosyltransferase
MSSTGQIKCSRCRQSLPNGTTFCVGCGIQNQADASYKQSLKNEQKIAEGKRRSKLFRWLASLVTGRPH